MGNPKRHFRWYEGLLSRTGESRLRFREYGGGHDRGGLPMPVAGRQARHDGVAMCLLRKDISHAMPMRKVHKVRRNRRILLLLWILVLLWWVLGWFFF